MGDPSDPRPERPTKAARPRPIGVYADTVESGEDQAHDAAPRDLGESQLYEIESELAQGGMGRVMRARDRRLGRVVALKLLRQHAPDQVVRFEREAAITARLQHPGIVPVYAAGRLSNDEPFYAMPLVSGRPLDAVIGQAASLGDRIALVPNVIAVADALAYAHDQRIIHRDLKPQNVIVGRFGETLVIDWGLAKDLAQSTPDEPGRLPVSEEGGHATQTGAVLGTPAYMAPEQARGEPIDERADVYALGAILFHTLSGTPPHAGTSSSAVVRDLGAGTLAPTALLAAEVPVDLQAIVYKAMAREAAARYRNAGELASDLRRFQSGQLVGAHRYSLGQRLVRSLRRHRAAALAGGTLLVLLAVTFAVAARRVLVERQHTRFERERAETRGRAAEGMVDFLVDKLYHRLYDLGRLDLLEGLGESVTHYYDLAAPDDATLSAARSRAAALEVIGGVARKKGDEDGALRMLGASLAIRTKLAARFPDNQEWPLGMAALLYSMSQAHQYKGESDAALADVQAAIAALDRPVVAGSTSANRGHQLVYAWLQLGQIHRAKGELDATRTAFGSGLQVAEATARQHPEEPRTTDDLAMITSLFGEAVQDGGDLDAAARLFASAVASLERLLRTRPDSVDYQNSLTFALWHLAMVAYERGDFREMRAVSERAVTVAAHLAALDPEAGDQQDGLAGARLNLADAERSLGRHAEALRHYDATLGVAEALAKKHPENLQYLEGVGSDLCHAGDGQREAGHLPAARHSLERAVAIYTRELVPKDPANAEWREGAEQALGRLAEVDLAEGRPAEARARLDQARALLDQLLAKEPEKNEYRSFASVIETRLGVAQAALGDRDASLAAFRRALAVGEKLVAADPGAQRFFWHKRQAEAAYEMGRALPGRALEARPILARQVATLTRLRADGRIDAATANALAVWERAAR